MATRGSSSHDPDAPHPDRRATQAQAKIDAWDIARHAGVGKVTVARVLSGNPKYYVSQAMRERVQQAARELGYVPNPFARTLRSKRSRIIGICAEADIQLMGSDPADLTPRFYLDRRLVGILQNPMAAPYRIMLIIRSESDSDAELESKLLHDIEFIDGLIYLTPHQRYEALLRRLAARIPLVVEQGFGMQGFSSVSVDQLRAIEDSVRCLHDRGARRMGMIVTLDVNYLHNRQRIDAFRQTLASLKLPFEGELIVGNCRGERSAYDALNRLLRLKPSVDGVIVPRDRELVGAMDAIRDARLTFGRDIRLIAINETEIVRSLRPSVTAVHFPYEEVANQCFFILMRQIEGTLQKPAQILIPATINERETTLGLSQRRTKRKMSVNKAS